MSGSAKLAIAETCQTTNSVNNNGYVFTASKYVTSVTPGGSCAEPTVTAVSSTNTGGPTATFLFTGNYAVNTGRIDWVCTSSGATPAQVPADCR
ncbi:MAG: pilin [Xanthomonadales bacterium]|nr:pilin [Xanthomonadales bacterium]